MKKTVSIHVKVLEYELYFPDCGKEKLWFGTVVIREKFKIGIQLFELQLRKGGEAKINGCTILYKLCDLFKRQYFTIVIVIDWNFKKYK